VKSITAYWLSGLISAAKLGGFADPLLAELQLGDLHAHGPDRGGADLRFGIPGQSGRSGVEAADHHDWNWFASAVIL
jgi:hypothetical protein